MAIRHAIAVRETSTSTGTSDFTLNGAVDSFQSFEDAGLVGYETHYTIEDADGNVEVGIGTVGSGFISRDSVLYSTNGNELVDFPSGNKQVYCTITPDAVAAAPTDEDVLLTWDGENFVGTDIQVVNDSLRFAGDLSAQLYRPSSGILNVTGTLKVNTQVLCPFLKNLDSSKFILVGSGTDLQIGGSGTSGQYADVIFSNSANVGIGTTNPTARLHIATDPSNGGQAGLVIQTGTASYYSTGFFNILDHNGSSMFRIGTGAGQLSTIVIAGEPNGNFDTIISKVMNTSTYLSYKTRFEIERTGTPYIAMELDDGQSNNSPALKTLYTTHLATTSGNVGIGNTSPGAKLQIDTGAAATTGLIVKGYASQSASLTEWQNSSGTLLASVGPAGNIYTSGCIGVGGVNTAYKLQLTGTGDIVQRIYSSNNGAADIEFHGAGYRGSIKTNGSYSFMIDSNNEYAAGSVRINGTDTGWVSLAAGGGNVGIGTNTIGARLQVNTGAATTKGVIVKGTGGQTGNLTEWQDNSSVVKSWVTSDGTIYANPVNTGNLFTTPIVVANYGGSSSSQPNTGCGIKVRTHNGVTGLDGDAGVMGFRRWQSVADGRYYEFVVFCGSHGSIPSTPAMTVDVNGTLSAATIKATATLTANGNIGLHYSSTGTAPGNGTMYHGLWSKDFLDMVVKTGGNHIAVFTWDKRFGIGTDTRTAFTSKFGVINDISTTVGVSVKGAVSQTANLQQWENSSGTALAIVDASGRMGVGTASGLATTTPLSIKSGDDTRCWIMLSTSDGDTGYLGIRNSTTGFFQVPSGGHFQVETLGGALAPIVVTDVTAEDITADTVTADNYVASIASVSTEHTVTTEATLLVDATLEAIIVTLPAHAAGRRVEVKKTDSSINVVRVTPATGTVDGASYSDITSQYESITCVSDGSNWWLV